MKRFTRGSALLMGVCLLLSVCLGLFGCAKEAAVENRVTSVYVKKDEIVVEAVLTSGFLQGYEEKKVYLFELPSFCGMNVDLSELDPVDEAKPRPSLKFSLPAYDGVRSRLQSAYLVASYDPATRRYTSLTPPMSLSNPEAVADPAEDESGAERSIKGLISDYPADAIRMGIRHTVVDVWMDRLILSGWQEGAVSYVYNGVTRYLDAEELTRLDEAVGVYTAAGVEVYLRFRLGSPVGKQVPAGLYVSTASEAVDYAVNMNTSFSSIIIEGFFDFMASRYAAPHKGEEAVSAFILGYRVNQAVLYNHAGGMDLATYVTNYEKLTRVACNALRSHHSKGRVYVSLDGRRAVTDEQGWDVNTFLSAFANECRLRGDYAWHVASELHAVGSSVWEENAAADGSYYTVRNLGVLTDLLDSPLYRFGGEGGEPRRLLVSGYSIPAVLRNGTATASGEANQAASFAYAYMTCLLNGRVEALIYGTHADSSSTSEQGNLCGLWEVKPDTTMTDSGLDLTLRPSEPRPICDVFTVIDTTDVSSLSAALTELMGSTYTKLESTLAGKASAVTSIKGSGVLKGYEAEHKKASSLYRFNAGSLNGFRDGGNLTYMELIEAETLGTTVLHARFDRSSLCEPMGLTVTLSATELIGGKELVFDLYGGQIASAGSTAKPTFTLRLTRPSKGALADGDGELRYVASVEELKSGAWQTAVFNVSEFTALLDADDQVTLTLLMDYPVSAAPDGESSHDLGLVGISVVGHTAASESSAGVVIAVVVSLTVLIVCLVALLYLRHKKRGSGRR